MLGQQLSSVTHFREISWEKGKLSLGQKERVNDINRDCKANPGLVVSVCTGSKAIRANKNSITLVNSLSKGICSHKQSSALEVSLGVMIPFKGERLLAENHEHLPVVFSSLQSD